MRNGEVQKGQSNVSVGDEVSGTLKRLFIIAQMQIAQVQRSDHGRKLPDDARGNGARPSRFNSRDRIPLAITERGIKEAFVGVVPTDQPDVCPQSARLFKYGWQLSPVDAVRVSGELQA